MTHPITKKIDDLELDTKDLEMYTMTKINLGMQIDNQPNPIYIKHIPSGKTVVHKEYKSVHKNLMSALEKINKEIKK